MALAVLIQNSTGPEVANLQRALNYHLPDLFPGLKTDGVFGQKTQARVVEFQTRNALKPDGVVGPRTQRALYCFVECSHHLIIRDFPTGPGVRAAIRNGPSPIPSPSA